MAKFEDALKVHYTSNRDGCVRLFLEELRRTGLRSYTAPPTEQVLEGIGKSMDLLVRCLAERRPQEYVESQRMIFAQRAKQGVAVQDMVSGLEAAQVTMDKVIDAAYPEAAADAQKLKERAQRYLLMARTALVSLLAQQG